MISKPAFMSAGELHGVLPALQGGHVGNLQLCGRPSLFDSRWIQSAALDAERRGDNVSHFRKCATAKENFVLYSSVKRRGTYRQLYHQAPAATSREGFEQASTADSPSSSSGDDRNLSVNMGSENSAAQPVNRELKALDTYFSKLRGNPRAEQAPSTPFPASPAVSLSPDQEHASVGKPFQAVQTTDSSTSSDLRQDEKAKSNELRSVEAYFQKLGRGANFKQPTGNNKVQESERELEDLLKEISPSFNMASLYETLEGVEELDSEALTSPSASESYMVYLLVAINIAVYLFGLASPVETAGGVGSSTLPLLYGAKVNELILDGQWWRLITPMFLHSGFLHVGLSSWALLFFGPQVENVYGSLAFCMIYFLGGFCGNILSFFYTPAATVGGTGPFFAILISWVVYLVQNRKELGERSADYGIKMTASLGVLVICLSCLLPIDEWIHLGAIFPGALFGSFACPSVQVAVDGNNTPAKNRDISEGLYGVYEGPGPFKVTLAFSVFVAICLGLFSVFAPLVAESQLLENTLLF